MHIEAVLEWCPATATALPAATADSSAPSQRVLHCRIGVPLRVRLDHDAKHLPADWPQRLRALSSIRYVSCGDANIDLSALNICPFGTGLTTLDLSAALYISLACIDAAALPNLTALSTPHSWSPYDEVMHALVWPPRLQRLKLGMQFVGSLRNLPVTLRQLDAYSCYHWQRPLSDIALPGGVEEVKDAVLHFTASGCAYSCAIAHLSRVHPSSGVVEWSAHAAIADTTEDLSDHCSVRCRYRRLATTTQGVGSV